MPSHPTRLVYVSRGSSHTRRINKPADPKHDPVVERMTRGRLEKMSPAQAFAWKTSAFKKIKEVTPNDSELLDLLKYFNRTFDPVKPGPSNSDATTSFKKKQTKYSPTTPPGVTPSKRDGVTASILCYSPWA